MGEVRNALQAVRSSEERLDAAASAQRNASEQYESERRRFEAGLSTVFLVLERQTALVNAQARELRARADLNQAIAVLDAPSVAHWSGMASRWRRGRPTVGSIGPAPALAPGIAATRPCHNQAMRRVGRRFEGGDALGDQAALARTAAALRGTPFLVSRGVFRFRTFDEAETWMSEMIRRTHERLSPRTSPGSTGR